MRRFALPLSLITASLFFACSPEQADEREGPAPTPRDAGPIEDGPLLAPPPDATPDDDDPDVEIAQVEADAGPVTACDDGEDNDGDGRVDLADPGCVDADDDDEVDPIQLPACRDGVDNDDDGLVDLADPDCLDAADPTERGSNPVTGCNNRLDDDRDGLADFPLDPGCSGAGDDDETDRPVAPACANGADDDGDGATDYPADPGCEGRGDDTEDDPANRPACGNGVDDDGNGLTDWPDDPGCDSAADRDESNPCGDVELVDLNAHLAAGADAYDGTLADRVDGLVASCGGRAGGEVVFVYTIERLVERIVFTTRHPETEAPTVVYLRESCRGVDVACDRGNAATPGAALVVERPALGRYFVAVDTGSRDRIGAFRLTVEITYPPECRDGIDNDGDGLQDADDPGCAEFDDPDELDPETPPVCSNGLDDDGDGFVDYPSDIECLTAGYDREQPLCDLDIPFVAVGQDGGEFVVEAPARGVGSLAQGSCGGFGTPEGVLVISLDEPSDVFVDTRINGVDRAVVAYARGDCTDAQSELRCRAPGAAGPLFLDNLDRGVYFVLLEQFEAGALDPITATVRVESNLRACNDLVDNDGDGRVDLADPGCVEGMDDSEQDPAVVPQCADGIDNDNDGDIDWPDDDDCTGAGAERELPLCVFTEVLTEVGQAGGQVMYDTRGEPSVGRANCGGGGPQQVVAITIERASALRATIIAATHDTVIHLRRVCDDALSELACNDDFNGLNSQISLARLDPGTYFLFLDGFGGNSGTGTVDIVITPL
ncbi:MAG: hypothetical protein H6701_02615 [Myxococcales bacterium]|nr:hypothetical protein [Myxococcales bacterium]